MKSIEAFNEAFVKEAAALLQELAEKEALLGPSALSGLKGGLGLAARAGGAVVKGTAGRLGIGSGVGRETARGLFSRGAARVRARKGPGPIRDFMASKGLPPVSNPFSRRSVTRGVLNF